MIEDIKLDADEDGYHLIIEGDAVDACGDYLASLTRNLNLKIHRDALFRFYLSLERDEGFQEYVSYQRNIP